MKKRKATAKYKLYKEAKQRKEELALRATKLLEEFRRTKNKEAFEQYEQAIKEFTYEANRADKLAHEIVENLYEESEHEN